MCALTSRRERAVRLHSRVSSLATVVRGVRIHHPLSPNQHERLQATVPWLLSVSCHLFWSPEEALGSAGRLCLVGGGVFTPSIFIAAARPPSQPRNTGNGPHPTPVRLSSIVEGQAVMPSPTAGAPFWGYSLSRHGTSQAMLAGSPGI